MKLEKGKRFLDILPAWILTVVTIAAILWLTLAPKPFGDIEPPLFPGADKLVHAIMFGFLAFVIYIDKLRFSGWSRLSIGFIIFVAIAVIAFGIAIEFIQGLMHAGRSFDMYDMVADAAGTIIIALIFIYDSRRRKEYR